LSYTYEISFNSSSDYIEFKPTNFPEIETDREGVIYRDKVDEFRINSYLNESVYDTLELWFDDPTKFPLTNRIRIKKDTVVTWIFVFGIKQGEINYENKVYLITPEVEDQYTDIQFYSGRTVTTGGKQFQYVDEDDTFGEIYHTTQYLYTAWMAACLAVLNGPAGYSKYSFESAFLWNDDYPGGGSPGSDNYVSSDTNYLNSFALRQSGSGAGHLEIEHLMDVPMMFQCPWFCSSDFVIHFEHVSWFEAQIADYQLDLTGSDYYDDSRILKYSTPEMASSEKFFFPSDEVVLADYSNAQVQYDPEYVNYNSQKIDVRAQYDAYITSDFIDQFIAIGTLELAAGYQFTNGWTTFTTDGPDVTSGNANGAGNEARTNFVAVKNSKATINYSLNLTYTGSPVEEITLQGFDADGTANGSAVELAVGVNAGAVTGDHIRIRSTGSQVFNYTLSMTVTNRYRIPFEDGALSSVSRQNNYLSWANNLERFWTYSRFGESGFMNGSPVDFDSVKKLKEQDEFSFYHADNLDPMRGIKTDYGIGMIQSMTRDLATDFIKVKLRYE
jgi:hypothetical protein